MGAVPAPIAPQPIGSRDGGYGGNRRFLPPPAYRFKGGGYRFEGGGLGGNRRFLPNVFRECYFIIKHICKFFSILIIYNNNMGRHHHHHPKISPFDIPTPPPPWSWTNQEPDTQWSPHFPIRPPLKVVRQPFYNSSEDPTPEWAPNLIIQSGHRARHFLLHRRDKIERYVYGQNPATNTISSYGSHWQ